MNSGSISLPQNKWDNEGQHLFRLVQQCLVCLSVIFVSRWRIRNMNPHVSCKPDGWIPIGVSRIYILILRWVSFATRLQITYLVFDTYVDFSTFQGVQNNLAWEYGRRGTRGRQDGETPHRKWLDLGISLLDWYKLTASWINPIRCFQPLYWCAVVFLGHISLFVVVWLNVVSFWQAPKRHRCVAEESPAIEEEIGHFRLDSIVEFWESRVRCSKCICTNFGSWTLDRNVLVRCLIKLSHNIKI